MKGTKKRAPKSTPARPSKGTGAAGFKAGLEEAISSALPDADPEVRALVGVMAAALSGAYERGGVAEAGRALEMFRPD